MWKINQKVVCVWSGDWKNIQGEITPVKGEIYTIREIEPFCGGFGLRFHEIINKPMYYGIGGFGECNFNSTKFRPVDETFGESVAEKLEKEFISQPEPALV